MFTLNNICIFTFAALAAACSPNGIKSVAPGAAYNDHYIVVFKKPAMAADSLTTDYGLPVAQKKFSSSLHGAVYQMSSSQAEAVANLEQVAYVEPDQIIRVSSVETGATWGLDRIDQSGLPLDGSYSYDESGTKVNAYIIDTGILITNREFEGRARAGVDIVEASNNAVDCNGHGTHVAGTVGSRTYGVAKGAVNLIAVRVLNCDGEGALSDVIAGIDWVTANHVSPAVANMSLGGGISQAIDDAVTASIASGVTYAVAAGNDSADACGGSPARVPAAITVGSTDSDDGESSYSDFGSCVSLFAPGRDITSTWIGSDTATNTISGTSMATPHVTGAVALYLSKNPLATPAQVKTALVAGTVSGRLTGVSSGTVNKLLNTEFIYSKAE